MILSANSPKNPETSKVPTAQKTRGASFSVGQTRARYKGGRKLLYAERFRIWREVQDFSRSKIAERLQQTARADGIHIKVEYLQDRLEEFENGRHKPPTWLVLLILQAYDITLPWNEFFDGVIQ